MALLQQDVLGLDITMNNAEAVGMVERTGHLARYAHGLGDGQLALASRRSRSDWPRTTGIT